MFAARGIVLGAGDASVAVTVGLADACEVRAAVGVAAATGAALLRLQGVLNSRADSRKVSRAGGLGARGCHRGRGG